MIDIMILLMCNSYIYFFCYDKGGPLKASSILFSNLFDNYFHMLYMLRGHYDVSSV